MNPARRIRADAALSPDGLLAGTVVRAERGAFAVRCRGGEIEVEARRAASCLLEPEPGDRVLVATPDGEAWVLAVLDRADPGSVSRVVIAGDLEIQVPDGRFGVAAQESIDLVTSKDLRVVAGGIDVHAVDASAAFERLTVLADLVRAELDRIKLVATRSDSTVEQVTERSKRSFRTVEELDCVRAETIDYAATKVAQVTARTTLVTAEELIKLDGEQVHIG